MPVATTSGNYTERKELETLDGGYVVIKRQTYGQYLGRRESTSQMHLKSSEESSNMEGVMRLISKTATATDFASCIVEHNLTDEAERALDFKKQSDVFSLDPRIGDEIGKYIDEMNQFSEADQGN